MSQLLTAFLVGSSWPAFIGFFLGFGNLPASNINKQNVCLPLDQSKDIDGIANSVYKVYSRVAPLYLGLMSTVAAWLHVNMRWSLTSAFLAVGVLSALIVSTVITACRVYTWDESELIKQYARLQLYHFITYSIIIRPLFQAVTTIVK